MTTLEMRPGTEARRPTPAGTRFVDVRANLMPPEVLSDRQTDVVRRRVLMALAGIAALLVLAFGASWLQTHSARSDLADLRGKIAASVQDQNRYGKLAAAQNEVQTTRTQLAQLMTGDLSWNKLMSQLQAAAPSGIAFTSVDGTVTAATAAGTSTTVAQPAAGTTTVDPLNTTGQPVVGTLAIAGTARDSTSVASFSDSVSRLKGVTSVLITNVAGGKSGITFTLTASLTGKVLGGRFTPSTTTGTTTTQGGN